LVPLEFHSLRFEKRTANGCRQDPPQDLCIEIISSRNALLAVIQVGLSDKEQDDIQVRCDKILVAKCWRRGRQKVFSKTSPNVRRNDTPVMLI
jgi:predicted metalloenzyme YecM